MDNCLICGRQFEYAHHGNKRFCEECRKIRYREIRRRANKRYNQNPENRKKLNAYNRIYCRRRRTDPEYRRRMYKHQLKWIREHRGAYNKSCNEAYHRRMNNPAYRKMFNERARLRYRRKKLGLPPLGLTGNLNPRKK